MSPLWWSTTSAVTLTPASTHGSLVTVSPSTTSSVESSTLSPTLLSEIRSTSMTSPTATFCWRPPVRTIAYTRNSLSLVTEPLTPAARREPERRTTACSRSDPDGLSGLSRRMPGGSCSGAWRVTMTRRRSRLRGAARLVKPVRAPHGPDAAVPPPSRRSLASPTGSGTGDGGPSRRVRRQSSLAGADTAACPPARPRPSSSTRRLLGAGLLGRRLLRGRRLLGRGLLGRGLLGRRLLGGRGRLACSPSASRRRRRPAVARRRLAPERRGSGLRRRLVHGLRLGGTGGALRGRQHDRTRLVGPGANPPERTPCGWRGAGARRRRLGAAASAAAAAGPVRPPAPRPPSPSRR